MAISPLDTLSHCACVGLSFLGLALIAFLIHRVLLLLFGNSREPYVAILKWTATALVVIDVSLILVQASTETVDRLKAGNSTTSVVMMAPRGDRPIS